MDKQKLARINMLLEQGVLVDPDITEEELIELEKKELKNSEDTNSEDTNNSRDINKKNIKTEKEKIIESKDFQRLNSGVKIVRPYIKKNKKLNYLDFVYHLNNRFKTLTTMLRTRQELQGVISLNKLNKNSELNNTRVSLIGMILQKNETKNNNIILTIEDPTGTAKVLFHTKNEEYYKQARDLVLDEVIGITGTHKEGLVFGETILYPDVPMGKEFKKNPLEEYMVVVGDMHVGSQEFLKEDFEKFIKWINGELGNEKQKQMASKVKYIIFTGDLVEGVGVYPGQENDLEIKDIKEQYLAYTNIVKKIPSHIQIIMIPGNHDAGRIAEPQLPPYKDLAEELYALPNVLLTTSPGTVNIGATEDFPGFDLLLYHGYSFIYYSDNVESIRQSGGQKASEKIMKFLLQRRHLAPTHASNLYVPDRTRDPLIIETVPDFFITGHIHRVSFANYKSVTMINGSCWTDITDDQEKRGLEPQPARLPIINLQTREVSIINFYGGRRNES